MIATTARPLYFQERNGVEVLAVHRLPAGTEVEVKETRRGLVAHPTAFATCLLARAVVSFDEVIVP